jgi:hypothetical protein
MLNPQSNLAKSLVAIAIIATVVLLAFGGFFLYSSGKASVQKEFTAYKVKQEGAYTTLQNKYDALSAQHKAQSDQNTKDLQNANQAHQVALSSNAVEYGKRLLASEARASVYQRQAQAGTAECNSLASHAARLDASLEEGRYVVRDLRTTLGQRDETIRILGKELISTRNLITSE